MTSLRFILCIWHIIPRTTLATAHQTTNKGTFSTTQRSAITTAIITTDHAAIGTAYITTIRSTNVATYRLLHLLPSFICFKSIPI